MDGVKHLAKGLITKTMPKTENEYLTGNKYGENPWGSTFLNISKEAAYFTDNSKKNKNKHYSGAGL